MRVYPILPVVSAVAVVALSASPAVAAVSAPGARNDYQAAAEVTGHSPHTHGPPSPTATPTQATTVTPTTTLTQAPTATTRSAASASSTGTSSASAAPSSGAGALPSQAPVGTPGAANASDAPTGAGSFGTPAGTTTGDGSAGGGGAGTGVVGGLSVLLALAGGGTIWLQRRNKRRPKATRPVPATVPLVPLAHLALPPAKDPSAEQGQWGSQDQAPWEQPTLIDVRWAQNLPHAENLPPRQGEHPYDQDPQQHSGPLRLQALSPVENPFLDQDPAWSPGSPPPVPPSPDRRTAPHPHLAQHPHPHPAQHPHPDGYPNTPRAGGPAPGKRRKPR